MDGLYIMENPIKMDDLGVPLFFGNTHVWKNIFGAPLLMVYLCAPQSFSLSILRIPIANTTYTPEH